MPTINKPRRQKNKETNVNLSSRRKIYSSARWLKLRLYKFACDPLCEMCLKKGKTTPAEDIHHIVSFMSTDDPTKRQALAYDYDNLMSLCKQCHQEIHNKKH